MAEMTARTERTTQVVAEGTRWARRNSLGPKRVHLDAEEGRMGMVGSPLVGGGRCTFRLKMVYLDYAIFVEIGDAVGRDESFASAE